MKAHLLRTLHHITGAKEAIKTQQIQSLWSGYGEIARYQLIDAPYDSVVVKHVKLPEVISHPRGWNSEYAHLRKVRSYEVECAWYNQFSAKCHEQCPVAHCFGTYTNNNEYLMVLEDLDANGFSVRKQQASIKDMHSCLSWLAHFHAVFLFDRESSQENKWNDLWRVGGYWHLDTRPHELNALKDTELKQAAVKIDETLKACRFQTLVHGDAKLANFCFSDKVDHPVAVDFQYVGQGCGIKDVVYFIGSCLDSHGCEKYAENLLDDYFQCLKDALNLTRSSISFNDLQSSWLPMYEFAWADFQRFLKGWSPDHWKIHEYSERMTRKALNQLSSGFAAQ